jgi:AraC family transcriptional regulator of adaptative response/methylated-DNA-[protein]-cysteine methyltransferase
MGHLKKLLAKNPKALKQFLLPKTANLFDVVPKPEPRKDVKFDVVLFQNAHKNALAIEYSEMNTKYGMALAASTSEGLCFLGLDTNKISAKDDLISRFPEATFNRVEDAEVHRLTFNRLEGMGMDTPISLALYGTDFQCKIWQRLSTIPRGSILAYSDLAKEMGDEKLSRAVGTAIGSNPIACLIPCHRVVQNTGGLGGYMWGLDMKIALLSEELNFENY